MGVAAGGGVEHGEAGRACGGACGDREVAAAAGNGDEAGDAGGVGAGDAIGAVGGVAVGVYHDAAIYLHRQSVGAGGSGEDDVGGCADGDRYRARAAASAC